MLSDPAVGMRTNASVTDLSTVLPENIEQEVKEQAEISMGFEISEDDVLNISHLCDQVSLTNTIVGSISCRI